MPKSPQDVYARHLISPRGYPLWMPEPSHELLVYRQDGLRIGDVGVVIPEDGCFDVFFNICLPQDHPFHRATGVPDNFKPIELSDMDIRTAVDVENPGRVIANSSVKSVRIVERPGDSSSSTQPSGIEYEFTLSSSEGALLILPEGAERRDLRNHHRFLEVATQHGADWYRFAEERVGQIIANDSLYLITGLYKTRSWSLAAFEKTGGTAVHSAQFRVSQAGGHSIAPTYTWDTTRALDWRVGPTDNYGLANQSVFIRGFKIALRTGMFGTRRISVRADVPSARPNPVRSLGAIGDSLFAYVFGGLSTRRTTQPSGSGMRDEGPSSLVVDDARIEIQNSGALAVGEHVVIQRIPEASQAFHPSDIINRYLLDKEPTANVAITHDNDWIALLEENLLQPEELGQEGRLATLVSQKYDVVSEEGTVYLQSRRDSESVTFNAEDVDAAAEKRKLDSEDSDAMAIDVVSAIEQEADMTLQDDSQVDFVTTSLEPIITNRTTRVDPLAARTTVMTYNDRYQCNWLVADMPCGHIFTTFSNLIVHLGHAHDVRGSADRKLVCHWLTNNRSCGMVHRRDSFRRHISTHLSSSILCSECDRRFSRRDVLRAHIKRNHPGTDYPEPQTRTGVSTLSTNQTSHHLPWFYDAQSSGSGSLSYPLPLPYYDQLSAGSGLTSLPPDISHAFQWTIDDPHTPSLPGPKA